MRPSIGTLAVLAIVAPGVSGCGRAPDLRTAHRIRVVDRAGQTLELTDPVASYLDAAVAGRVDWDAYCPEGLLTDGAPFPWGSFTRLAVGEMRKRDTTQIPGNVPGSTISELYACEVTAAGSPPRTLNLLDTADGAVRGMSPLGPASIPLRDIASIEALAATTSPGPLASPRCPPWNGFLRVRLPGGREYDASPESTVNCEFRDRRYSSARTGVAGVCVTAGKAVLTLGWASLKRVRVLSPTRELEVQWDDGRTETYALPSALHSTILVYDWAESGPPSNQDVSIEKFSEIRVFRGNRDHATPK